MNNVSNDTFNLPSFFGPAHVIVSVMIFFVDLNCICNVYNLFTIGQKESNRTPINFIKRSILNCRPATLITTYCIVTYLLMPILLIIFSSWVYMGGSGFANAIVWNMWSYIASPMASFSVVVLSDVFLSSVKLKLINNPTKIFLLIWIPVVFILGLGEPIITAIHSNYSTTVILTLECLMDFIIIKYFIYKCSGVVIRSFRECVLMMDSICTYLVVLFTMGLAENVNSFIWNDPSISLVIDVLSVFSVTILSHTIFTMISCAKYHAEVITNVTNE